MRVAWRVTWGLVAELALAHALLSLGHGGALPDAARAWFGASAATLFSRPWAQLTAPFFHESWGHLAYNSVLLFLGMPRALAAFGWRRGLGLALAGSPVAGALVDALVILPLAATGVDVAERAAPERLVGASVVAFAAIGLAAAAYASRVGWMRAAPLAALVVAYEGVLAAAGLTRPFVGAFHVTGFLWGLAWGAALARRRP